MKNKLLLFSFLSLTFACQEKSTRNDDFVDYSIGDLIIIAPAETKFIKETGVDSYVAYIADKGDTFNVELGKNNTTNFPHSFPCRKDCKLSLIKS